MGGKLAASLLAPTAFTFVADLAGTAEGAGAGLRWADLWAGAFPPGAALCMLLADAALYGILAWCAKPYPIWSTVQAALHNLFVRIQRFAAALHCSDACGIRRNIMCVRSRCLP